MADNPSLWDRLSDALPWNRRKVQEREELERALHELAPDEHAPAASAAEAMADLRKARAARAPKPSPKPQPPEATPDNTDLRERWRGSAPGKPGSDAMDEIRRKKGG